MTTLIVLGILAVIVISILIASFVEVRQQELKIVERFGKWSKTFRAGINWKWFFESVAGSLSLKLEQADVRVQAKTKDNVFVEMVFSVQYQVIEEQAYDAFYKLQDPLKQIESFVFNSVRSEVPKLSLEEVFAGQNHIAKAVDEQLAGTMKEFGYAIKNVLVTQVVPPNSVYEAMNQVKASEQNKIAAENKAEANKIIVVKAAEAEKETKRLNGEGIAAERQAIVDGMEKAVKELSDATKTDPTEAMHILMTTQYYDTLKAVGTAPNLHTILLPYGPEGADKVREAIMEANLATKRPEGKKETGNYSAGTDFKPTV